MDTKEFEAISRKETVESKVNVFQNSLKEKHELIGQYKKGVDVLFLSCDTNLRLECQRLMNADGYNALTIEDFKEQFKFLPEFEIEKEAIKMARIIITIEPPHGHNPGRCPGLIQECSFIMQERKYQDKTVLVVDEIKPYEDLINLEKHHYLYFPKLYRCPYNNRGKLIELCVGIAKKKVHRHLLMVLNENDTKKHISSQNK